MTQPAMGGQPPIPPGIFATKRIRRALTLTEYLRAAEQAEAPMAVPEEGVLPSFIVAERCSSFGPKYLGGAEGGGSAPSPLAAGASPDIDDA